MKPKSNRKLVAFRLTERACNQLAELSAQHMRSKTNLLELLINTAWLEGKKDGYLVITTMNTIN